MDFLLSPTSFTSFQFSQMSTQHFPVSGETGYSHHAMKLHSSLCGEERGRNSLGRQNGLLSLPRISLSPLDFGVGWRIDFPIPNI